MTTQLHFRERHPSAALEQSLPERLYRVIYADTDAMGVVYHARYLEMAERARNEALEDAGIQIGRITEENNLSLVVHRVAMEFIAPVHLDDKVILRTGILNRRSSRVWWRTEVVLNGARHALVDVATVCFDRKTRLPVAAPGFLEQALNHLPVFREQGEIR
ncbi:MAG TPA: acyl-CoA thioesterase [Geoalkalibacter subterraneus]|jgi:acyl-CoA thioester hydrolase|uniref:Acyl-CoA thioesterase n=1 Tax=Geoalkalibacter subterraneus TaxID=483547 RepID=A0A831LR96_9BACT|nr:acyl-CoA thioesterase [Geoalkalibacter subterraneus]